MTIERRTMAYEIDGTAFESLAVWDGAQAGPRPAVLVVPTFMGRAAFEEAKAEALASLGYVAVAMDLYGVDVRPTDDAGAVAAMSVVNGDRQMLAARMLATVEQVRALDVADAARVAAIGFCLGGKCVLDLARTGSDVLGVAAFHGIFDRPGHKTADRITARVLAMHGWDDELATPEDVLSLAKELTDAGANWELDAYGHTGHAFTNPGRPTMFRPQIDKRSWARLTDFLAEVFA